VEDDDSYDKVTAHYYDAAYAQHPAVGPDVAFYRDLAREAGGPVLEVGCGTGRVLQAIAAEGLPCTGLDAAPGMLARLTRDAPEVRTVVGDMRDFDLGQERFALIYSAFRPFQHLTTVDDQLRCLGCLARHLAPGGRVAFDVFRPSARIHVVEEPEAIDLEFEQDGEQVARHTAVWRDAATQVQRIRFRYVASRDGAVVREDETFLSMRWFFRYELEHLMARAGFEVEIYGDFERGPVTVDSKDFVVVGRRVSGG
jgi:SAM-dependent methyltransferase